MKFHVHLSHLRLHALQLPKSSLKPYIKVSFDGGFKKLLVRPVSSDNGGDGSVSVGDSTVVNFQCDAQFVYDTAYHFKLHHKLLSFKLYAVKPFSDAMLGQVSLDLHTVVTGPVRHDLPLYSGSNSNTIIGRLSFQCAMEQEATITVLFKSIALSALPLIKDKQPITHLVYNYSANPAKKAIKTHKITHSQHPEFHNLDSVRLSGRISAVWRECLEIDVKVKSRSREKSEKLGSVRLPFAQHHRFDDAGGLSIIETVRPTPDFAPLFAQCQMKLFIVYSGLIGLVQMTEGLHTERGIIDGQRFTMGVQLPCCDFYSATEPNKPIALTEFKTPPKSVRKSGGREASVVTSKSRAAAKEYENRDSIVRRDDDDSDPTHRVAAADTTSIASSRGISRSNSIDIINGRMSAVAAAASGSVTVSQPQPPVLPPKPRVSMNDVRISLRALEIDDSKNPFNDAASNRHQHSYDNSDSVVHVYELSPSPQSHSHSQSRSSISASPQRPQRPQSLAHSPQPSPSNGGNFGPCTVCHQAAPFMCAVTLVPVCSYQCKMTNLQSQSQSAAMPPPVNPNAVTASSSQSHGETGATGICVVCDQPASFMCRDTQLPVCSQRCKQTSLVANRPLLQGEREMPAPVASAPSRTLVLGPSLSPPLSQSPSLPVCVVCHRSAEFKCNVLDVPVCSRDCKNKNLTQHQSSSAGDVSCPHCTFVNRRGASVCEICRQALVSYAANPHAAVKYRDEQKAPLPTVPARPSFRPVSVPGGPGLS